MQADTFVAVVSSLDEIEAIRAIAHALGATELDEEEREQAEYAWRFSDASIAHLTFRYTLTPPRE